MTSVEATNNNAYVIGELQWPEYNGSKPVTTGTARQILEAIIKEASVEYPTEVDTALELLTKLTSNNKIWRKQYDEIYVAIVQIQQKVTLLTLHKMVQAAINKANELFVYRINNNNNADIDDSSETTISLQDIFSKLSSSTLSKAANALQTIEYTNPNTTNDQLTFPLASPIDNTSSNSSTSPTLLRGTDAIAQVTCWRDYGCLEASAADHAIATFQREHSTKSDEDTTKTLYVILGITSELAPSKLLLQHVPNSHVIGISRNPITIMDWYKDLCTTGQAAVGTQLHVAAGDFLKEFPIIAQWIVETIITKASNTTNYYNRLVLLPMGYMDGEANVRLCIAMDQICNYIIQQLSSSSSLTTLPITVGYWISPSTVYSIPKQCVTDAVNRYETNESSLFNSQKLLSLLSFGKFLQPSSVVQAALEQKDDDSTTTTTAKHDDGILFNGVMKLQGPNYLLAKMLQQWRCIDVLLLQQQQETTGSSSSSKNNNVTVLAPHAPPSRTVSVTHSAEAYAAIEGMPYIAPPLITFSAPTCSTLMTAIMLHQLDILNETSSQSSSSKQQQQQQNYYYKHPHQIFWDGSVHGGIWTCPYDGNSLGIPSYILGKVLINTKQHGSYPSAALVLPGSSKSDDDTTTTTTDNNATSAV